MIEAADPNETVGWAVRLRSGYIIAELGQLASEKRVWEIALGWPSVAEIAEAIRGGARVYRCILNELPAEQP